MINKSDYWIKGWLFPLKPSNKSSQLTSVWSQTKDTLFGSFCDALVRNQWFNLIRGLPLFDQCAGFSPFPRQGVWLHPCRPSLVWCHCGFFLSFSSFSFLSMIYHNWPTGTIINRTQVFTLAAPSFPPSFPSLLSLSSWVICLPDCPEFNWNIIHIGR